MQTQCNVCVFGGIGHCLLNSDLIKGQLPCPFACHLSKTNGGLVEIFLRQTVHIMTRSNTVEDIGFEHSVEGDALQMDTMLGQYAHIIFNVLADLFDIGIF